MATKLTPYNPKVAEELKTKADELSTRLQDSNTAYAAGTQATPSDIYDQAALDGLKNKIKIMEGQKLADQWYGAGRSETTFKGEGTGENIFSKGLNMLSAPLYATAGAAEWALGKGSSKSLGKNINENIKQREGFGNILSRSGLPYAATLPIGFALDVAFDPVNWATAGTAALLPRAATGLFRGAAKGGLEGAAKGVSSAIASRMLPLATKTADVMSLGTVSRSLRKTIPAADGAIEGGRIAQGIAGAARKIAATTAKATETFDTATGRSMVKAAEGTGTYGRDLIRGNGHPGWNTPISSEPFTLGQKVETALKMLPNGIGENIIKTFKYSPKDWLRLKILQDKAVSLIPKFKAETGGMDFYPQTQEAKNAIADGITPVLGEPGAGSIKEALDPNLFQKAAQNESLPLPTRRIAEILAPGVDAGNNTKRSIVMSEGGSDGIMANLLQESGYEADFEDIVKDLQKIREGIMEDKTGIKAVDDLSKYLRSILVSKVDKKWEIHMPKKDASGTWRSTQPAKIARGDKLADGEKVIKPVADMLDAYAGYISAFKTSKIGLSASAWVNALLGNMVMAEMSGISIANPKMYRAMMEAKNLAIKGEKYQPDVIKRMFQNNQLMEKWAHQHPMAFASIMNFNLDSVLLASRQRESIAKAAIAEGKALGYDPAETRRMVDDLFHSNGVEREGISGGVSPISFAANEMPQGDNWFKTMQEKYANKAKQEGARWFGSKGADLALNKAMEAYGSTDQIWRMGTIVHLTEDGLSEAEIRKVGRIFGMSGSDIADVYTDAATGEKMFKLMPEKAMHIASETYMNYAAMPAVVKVLRNLPLVGAPLVSFSYGMGVKAGKAALYNPAIYNKINFLMTEIQGDKSPLEKQALKEPYYNWYNQPGMIKLPIPFFEQNPIYADLQSLIPYYSLNMFTPSERKYSSTLPDQVLAALDKLPILQDPAGQVMFDYFIQPLMLQKGEIPQNSFGSPLFPKDATGLQKTGYFARQLGEAVTPGVAGFLGVPAGMVMDADKLDWIPSYKFRGMAHAVQGENPLGITSKESAGSRSIRQFMSMFGIQLHPMNTAYTSKQAEKGIIK